MDSTEDDDITVQLCGFTAQLQGIADKISDVLHIRYLVIMGYDDCFPLVLQPFDFVYNLSLIHLFLPFMPICLDYSA
jgi:hypothetical protein